MTDAFAEAIGSDGTIVPAPPAPASPGGNVTLATVWPLTELTVPPLDEGGATVVITEEGTEVDADTAARAYEAAHMGGHQLKEI